jgi:hypothetical protein
MTISTGNLQCFGGSKCNIINFIVVRLRQEPAYCLIFNLQHKITAINWNKM